jgi:hypothetical protein
MSMRASHNDRWTLKGNFLKEKDEAAQDCGEFCETSRLAA